MAVLLVAFYSFVKETRRAWRQSVRVAYVQYKVAYGKRPEKFPTKMFKHSFKSEYGQFYKEYHIGRYTIPYDPNKKIRPYRY